MQKDAVELEKKCDQYQRFTNIELQPVSHLTSISALWPFAQWGADILSLFPPATRQ